MFQSCCRSLSWTGFPMPRDKRPPLEQVKSGFRIVGRMLAVFGVALGFIVGCVKIQTPELPHDLLFGIVLVVLSIGIMVGTARYWAAWFFGLVAYCAWRCLSRGFLLASAHHISMLLMAGMFTGLLVMAFLTYCFTSKRYTLTQLDRATLVIAAVCLLLTTTLFADTYRTAIVFSLGVVSLFVSWLAHRISRYQLSQRRRSLRIPV